MRQKNTPSVPFRFILALSSLLLAGNAPAIELGSMALRSALGAPFRAAIPVALGDGETLDAACLSSKVPDAGNSLPQLTRARLTVEKVNGRLQIQIRTDGPVNDPAFLLTLSVGCGYGLERVFPVLLDPPAVAPTRSGRSGSAFAANPAGTTEPAAAHPDAGKAAAVEMWEIQPGESPQSLAEQRYPGDLVLQNRMLAALALDNLGAFPDGVVRPLPPGTRLRLTSPQRIAATPRSRFEKAIRQALGKRSAARKPVFQLKVDGGLREKTADGGAMQKPGKLLAATDSDDLSATNLSLQSRLQEAEARLKRLQEIERELANQLAAEKKAAIKRPALPLPAKSPAGDGLTLWQAGLGGGLLTASVFGMAILLWRRKVRADAIMLRRLQERNSRF